MEIRNTWCALVIAALWALCAEAQADSYRCGRKLIRTGDSAAEVLRVCGTPGYKDRGQQTLRLGGAEKNANVERWYYKQSRRSLEHVVLLHKGRVVAIEVGAR
jgi:hypothetical protein